MADRKKTSEAKRMQTILKDLYSAYPIVVRIARQEP